MQLRRLSILIVGLVGLISSTLGFALGLGDIVVKSSYNEPLNAEIRLLQVRGLSEADIRVALASREDFSRIGLERDFFLTGLRFQVVLSNPNNPHIKVSSSKPVQEPYLNFLVDTQWPSGRLLREYTLLLDLPVFNTDIAAPPVVAPPVVETLPEPVVLLQPTINETVEQPIVEPSPFRDTVEEPVVEQPLVQPQSRTVAEPVPDRSLASNSNKQEFLRVEDAADSFIQSLSRQAAERKSSFQIQEPSIKTASKPKRVVRTPRPVSSSPTTTRRVIRSESQLSAEPPPQQVIAKDDTPRARPQAKPAKPQTPPPAFDEPEPIAKDQHRVKSGDTLWRIASQLRPSSSVSVQQTMLAIQAANPDAFIDDNINLLRKGKVLRAPTLSEIQQTNFRQAVSAVRQQTQAWRARSQKPVLSAVTPKLTPKPTVTRREGQLILGSADSSDSTKAVKGSGLSGSGESLQNELAITEEELDKASRENNNLKVRIAELEEQISTIEGLVSLSNDQLKALELTAANSQQNTKEQAEPPQEPGSGAENVAEKESAPKPVVDNTPIQKQPSAMQSIIDFIVDNLMFIAAGILVLLLALFLIFRFNQRDEHDDDEFELEPAAVEDYDELDESEELYDLDELDEPADEENTIEAKTDDVIAEADIYIGLGQTDNAEALLQKEIQQNPDNAAARVALLKLYASTQDADAFDDQYAQLLPLGDDQANAQAKTLRDSIDGVSDFDVDSYSLGEQPDLSESDNLVGEPDEFDLGEPELGDDIVNDDSDEQLLQVDDELIDLSDEEELVDDLDFDEGLLSELSEEDEPEQPSTNEEDDELDLDFDEELLEGLSEERFDEEDKASEPNTTDGNEVGDDFTETASVNDDLDLDLDLDLLDLDDEPDHTFEEDNTDNLEETVDTELSDEVEGSDQHSVEELPTATPEDEQFLDDELDFNLDELELELDAPEEPEVEDNDLDLDLESLDFPVDNEESSDKIQPSVEPEQNSQEELSDSLDLALEDLDSDTPAQESPKQDPNDLPELEFDLDSPPTADIDIASLDKEIDDMTALLDQEIDLPDTDTPVEPEPVAAPPVPVEELDPSSDEELGFVDDSDEVETKLDLAQAYIDMGDKHGAQDILQEVAEEGNTEQQQKAATLLEDL